MGFLGKMVTKTIVKKAEEVAIYNATSYMENTHSVSALVNKSTANYILIIKKKSVSIKRSFVVLDEFDNKKYVVKTDALTFGYPCIRLYNTEECEIVRVNLAEKTDLGIYTMYLDGKQLGTLSRKKSIKIKLELDFNGWHLNGNIMQDSFIVTDKSGNMVMKFNTAFTSRDTYVLEINNREYEIIGILLVMAVEIALHSNS